MKLTPKLIALLGIAASFLVTDEASAFVDGKSVTNSACHGTFKSDRDESEYHTGSLLAKTGEVQMNCGIVRDSIGKRLEWVDVRFDKTTTNKSIVGRIYSCNMAFFNCSWKSGSTSSNSGLHSLFIDTSTLPYSDTYKRYYSFWTRLPQGDKLLAIRYNEGT
ncbi:MAG: hypothetical protein OQK04_18260 [Kangiellaceae bacterium]|nr:hypothetical protein [Kangiellaceae bacterium]MCW9000660.1 hypothetical protein [Kangiellaceae bacterium]